MELDEVERVHAEVLARPVDPAAEGVRRVLAHVERRPAADLRGHEEPLPGPLREELADDALGAAVAVHVGRVDERHARVGRRVQRPEAVRVVDGAPRAADRPRAEADHADVAAGPAEAAMLHGCVLRAGDPAYRRSGSRGAASMGPPRRREDAHRCPTSVSPGSTSSSSRSRVKPGSKVRLPKDFDPRYTGSVKKEQATELLQQGVEWLSEFQMRLAAQDTWSLLVIFQAMDAAGKDGTIRHVMSGVNPQGVEVTSFKVPSELERDHDYLWRTALRLPARGMIGIFNRSYYEEVLVVRVHPQILDGQKMPTVVEGQGRLAAPVPGDQRLGALPHRQRARRSSSCSSTSRRTSRSSASSTGSRSRSRTGSSPRPTPGSGSTGTSTRRPSATCCRARRRRGRRGT